MADKVCMFCHAYFDPTNTEEAQVHEHPEPQSGQYRAAWLASGLPYLDWTQTYTGRDWVVHVQTRKGDLYFKRPILRRVLADKIMDEREFTVSDVAILNELALCIAWSEASRQLIQKFAKVCLDVCEVDARRYDPTLREVEED